MKKSKGGLTPVEITIILVIVVALASIFIPIIINIGNVSSISKDTVIVKEMNMALDAKYKEDEPSTAYEANQVTQAIGYNFERLILNNQELKVLWSTKLHRFVLLDGETYYYPTKDKTNKYTMENKENFFVCSNMIEKEYSTYYTGPLKDIVTTTGFDTGSKINIKSVTYTGKNTSQDVIIRTAEFQTKLVINGNSLDTVSHYGYSGLVEVKKVNMESYHEYGTIGRLLLEKGHIDIHNDAVVYYIEQTGTEEIEGENTLVSKVSIKENALVYGCTGDEVGLLESNSERFVDETERLKATTCGHKCGSDVITDGKHVYEVCKSCGYTLISLKDTKTNEVSSVCVNSVNGVMAILPMATYSMDEVEDDSEVVNGMVAIKESSDTESGFVDPGLIQEPKVDGSENICVKHEYEYSFEGNCKDGGNDVYTCKHCGSQYKVPFGKNEHKWDDNKHCCLRTQSAVYSYTDGGPTASESYEVDTNRYNYYETSQYLKVEGATTNALFYVSKCGDTVCIWPTKTNKVIQTGYTTNIYYVNNQKQYTKKIYGTFNLGKTDMSPVSLSCITQDVKKVIFKNGIKEIGSNLLYGCSSVEEVEFYTGLEAIRKGAFVGTNIDTITIPKGLTSIEEESFDTTSLHHIIVLGDETKSSGTYISANAFAFNDAIETVEFRGKVSVGSCAFRGCEGIKTVKFNGDARIYSFGFQGCISMTDIDLTGVCYIGEVALQCCESLTTLTLPKSIKTMQHWVTDGSYNLETIYVEYEDIPGGWDPGWMGTINFNYQPKTPTLQNYSRVVVDTGTYIRYGCTEENPEGTKFQYYKYEPNK